MDAGSRITEKPPGGSGRLLLSHRRTAIAAEFIAFCQLVSAFGAVFLRLRFRSAGIFYDKGAEGNYGWSPEFLKVLLVFIVIISFMIIKVFFKSIIDSIRYKTKTTGYKRSLSEIYSPDYYKCSEPNYDNSKRIENLQKLYPLIDKEKLSIVVD